MTESTAIENEEENPFKEEGRFYLSRGGVSFCLGAVILLFVKASMDADVPNEAWVQFVVAAVLLYYGAKAIFRGVMNTFKFDGNGFGFTKMSAYTGKNLADFLQGNKDAIFKTPNDNIIEKTLYSFLPKLVFAPAPVRVFAEKVYTSALITSVIVGLFGFAYLSGILGLTDFTHNASTDFIGWLAIGWVFTVWYSYRPFAGRTQSQDIYAPQQVGARKLVGAGALVGGILWLIPFPFLGVMPFVGLFEVFIGVWCLFVASLWLIPQTLPETIPEMDSASFLESWDVSIPPSDFSRFFELKLEEYNESDIPPLQYVKREPKLKRQGSREKGGFTGSALIEVNPKRLYEHSLASDILNQAALGGQVVIALSALWVFWLVSGFGASPVDNIAFLTGPITLGFIGATFSELVSLFLGEIYYSSKVVFLHLDGTYSESTISTGMSAQDSTRSENKLVRSRMNVQVYSSDIKTITYLTNQGVRFILSSKKEEKILGKVTQDLKKLPQNRSLLAGLDSVEDLRVVSEMHRLNDRSKQETRLDLPESEDQKRKRLRDETDQT